MFDVVQESGSPGERHMAAGVLQYSEAQPDSWVGGLACAPARARLLGHALLVQALAALAIGDGGETYESRRQAACPGNCTSRQPPGPSGQRLTDSTPADGSSVRHIACPSRRAGGAGAASARRG